MKFDSRLICSIDNRRDGSRTSIFRTNDSQSIEKDATIYLGDVHTSELYV